MLQNCGRQKVDAAAINGSRFTVLLFTLRNVSFCFVINKYVASESIKPFTHTHPWNKITFFRLPQTVKVPSVCQNMIF